MHRRTRLPAFALALLLAAPATATAVVEEPGESAPTPARSDLSRLMIKFKEGATESEIRAAHGRVRGRVTWRSRSSRWEAVAVHPGEDDQRALRRYRFHPAVENAELVRPRRIAAAPNDLLQQQWMFHNDGEPMGWCCPRLVCQPCSLNKARFTLQGTAGADINAVAAWELETGSREIVVAVLDTGIDLKRPDLSEHVIQGWDFVNDDAEADDDQSHGTGVSALIGAVGNNRKGLTGLNWNVSLMPLKVCDQSGQCASDDIIEAIDYAADHGAHVINMSLGCDEHRDPNLNTCTASLPGECFSQAAEDALVRAWQKGVVVVEAAGNCGQDNDDSTTTYPCAYDVPNNICAGSTDMDDQVSSFSDFGPATVEIGAPGQLVTTYRPGDESTYWQPNGTSFSSPITAGVAALLLARTPMSPEAVRERIVAGGNRLGAPGAAFMGGRLDAFGTLNNVFLPARPMGTAAPEDVTLFADVTRDGRVDLVRGIPGVGFEVSKNKGKKQIFAPAKRWSDVPPAPHVVAGDVDGNGRKDIIMGETGAGLQVLRARKKKFKPLEAWSAEDPGDFILAGDVNGDGLDDVIRFNGAFEALLSSGAGFEAPALWSAEGLRDFSRLADVNGDGRADLVHWTSLPGSTRVEVSVSTGSGFSPPVVWLDTMPMSYLGLGDFDGDGLEDLVAFDPDSGCIRVMRGRNGSFGGTRAWTCPEMPDLVFAGQASRNRKDGRADLVTWTDGLGWELIQSVR